MKTLRFIILLWITIALLSASACAAPNDLDTLQRETYGITELEAHIPEEADTLFDGLTLDKALHPDLLLNQFWRSVSGSSDLLVHSALQNALSVFLLCFLFSVMRALPMDARQGKIVGLIGALALSLFCVREVDACVPLGFQAVDSISGFSAKLLPALCAAATAGGAVTSAGVKYTISTLVLDLFITTVLQIIRPILKAYIALCVTGIITQNEILQSVTNFAKALLRVGLVGTAIIFTTYLTVTGILNESVDAASAKAAKTLISSALPVVGGILSDAASSIVSGAGILRSGVGVLGFAAVFAICWLPYLALGLHFLFYRLLSGFAAAFSDRQISALLKGFSDIYGMILGSVGAVSLVLFIAIASLMKGVNS